MVTYASSVRFLLQQEGLFMFDDDNFEDSAYDYDEYDYDYDIGGHCDRVILLMVLRMLDVTMTMLKMMR